MMNHEQPPGPEGKWFGINHLRAIRNDFRHFSHEQFPGGLYERMGAYGPKYHPQLQVLIEDHCIILSGIRAVLERSKVAGVTDEPALMSDLAEVIKHLRRHEQREHELAEQLIMLDTRTEESD